MMLCWLAVGSAHADSKPVTLSNGYISLDIAGSGIVRMQVDPAGKHPQSMSFVKYLRPEFWRETPDTHIEVSRHKATISNLEIWEYRGIATNVGTDTPAKLEPGHTLGQTFHLPAGTQLASVEVRLPTWNSKTSGATLSLYRDGKLVASKKLVNVPDNSWQSIASTTPQFEGLYTVEISDPRGDIGWWSSTKDVSPIGEALLDGKPVDADRALQVHTNHMVGKGTMTISLDRSKFRVDAEFTPTGDMQYRTFPWRWRTTWTKDGYDCTPKSGTVFSRFFTDNQRYLPIQWFKRRDTGAYSFDGCKWIEMDGTRDADLRLEGEGMHLHWELRPDEMHLRFDTPLERAGDKMTTHFTLAVNKRDDAVPDEFPHFACSDKAVERDLNTFWWERGFSYPYPPNQASEWLEWTALARAWFVNTYDEEYFCYLLDFPMTQEGYVHVGVDTLGWPLVPNRDTRHFDTNARFILGCWRHYMWTGDREFLIKQADRLRKAMEYQLEVLKGKDGLIVTPDFKTGRHEDLSDNYWDILPFGHLDAYANAAFHGSILAMAQIEEQLLPSPRIGSGLGRQQSAGPREPAGGEGSGDSALRTSHSALRSPLFYRKLADLSHKRYDETFWLEDKGRYAGCVDSDGVKHDYGFTFVNLEALYYGLGDKDKARRIYHWMETEPTSSGKPDTYTAWIFAPRSTTIHNPEWRKTVISNQSSVISGESGHSALRTSHSALGPWWTYWWHGTPYGDQCQDGGAILYTSFFDLMERVKYSGADNAWQRFTEILGRYRMPDRLCGGNPLYRGEKPQQEDAGAVGVDMPFPESGLVPLYFLYGIIGVEPTPDGLRITPHLPKALSYAEVKYLSWHGYRISIHVTHKSIHVKGSNRKGHSFSRQSLYRDGDTITINP